MMETFLPLLTKDVRHTSPQMFTQLMSSLCAVRLDHNSCYDIILTSYSYAFVPSYAIQNLGSIQLVTH